MEHDHQIFEKKIPLRKQSFLCICDRHSPFLRIVFSVSGVLKRGEKINECVLNEFGNFCNENLSREK